MIFEFGKGVCSESQDILIGPIIQLTKIIIYPNLHILLYILAWAQCIDRKLVYPAFNSMVCGPGFQTFKPLKLYLLTSVGPNLAP